MSTLTEQMDEAIATANKRMAEYAQMRQALCAADAMLQRLIRMVEASGNEAPDSYNHCFALVRRAIDATS